VVEPVAKGKATKTITNRLLARQLEGWSIDLLVSQTKTLFNQAVEFYFLVINTHSSAQGLGINEATAALENLTVPTKKRTAVSYPLPWQLPSMFRRAAITKAVGAFSSFSTNLEKWKAKKADRSAKNKKFTERPPVPPRTWNFSPVFYSGTYQLEGKFVRLKLYTGKSWGWVKFALSGRSLPEDWKQLCPALVQKGKRYELHFPVQKVFSTRGKAIEQAKNPNLRITATDLNLDGHIAVTTVMSSDGTHFATRFDRGGKRLSARRKRLLGKVARKRQQTGTMAVGESDNKQLWSKIRHLNDYEGHRISKRINQLAAKHGATIHVFEHLANLKPDKGRYSRRSNQKRAYWLKSAIYRETKDKGWRDGRLTCRVNPKNTSRLCSHCDAEVLRHVEHEQPTEYHPGSPLFICPNGHRGNADFNASCNIGFKFFARYGYEKPNVNSGEISW